jgi:streptogramin lyase
VRAFRASYPLSAPAFNFARGIAAGPDGNVWFTEDGGNSIGRMTPAGVVTEFPLPTASSFPSDIASGPDGNLWFTEFNANQIGRITTAGVITEFPLPNPNSGLGGITAGPDGAMWFAEQFGNRIGRITTGQAPIAVIVPTLSFPMLALLGLALAGAAVFRLRQS